MNANRRRKVLLPGTFQIRLLGKFLGIALAAILAQVVFVAQQLSDLASRMPVGGEHLFSEIPGFLIFGLAVSLVVLIPAVGLIAVNATFRVAGPVYRLERYLESVIRDEADRPCTIRDKDELHYLCDLINQSLEAVRERAASEARAAEGSKPGLEGPPSALPSNPLEDASKRA